MDVLKFVGVSHHINSLDTPAFYEEGGRLKQAIGFARDEAGQAVDEAMLDQRRLATSQAENRRQSTHDLHCAVKDTARRRTLATAV